VIAAGVDHDLDFDYVDVFMAIDRHCSEISSNSLSDARRSNKETSLQFLSQNGELDLEHRYCKYKVRIEPAARAA
jgi:hypothetical protein